MTTQGARLLLLLSLLLTVSPESWAGDEISPLRGMPPPEYGSSIFFTRVYHCMSNDAVELYNARSDSTIDFSGWFLSDGETTQQIGVPGNIWSVLQPFEKRFLRRGEPGSFSFSLDYDDVLYLIRPDLVIVEQMGWFRDDGACPDSCMTRNPETGGFHDGNDWVTSGGDAFNYTLGAVRYEPCPAEMLDPVSVDPPNGASSVPSIQPNPARGRKWPFVTFSVPKYVGDGPRFVSIELYDLAGRQIREVYAGQLSPGQHRIDVSAGRTDEEKPIPGVYFLRLRIGNATGSGSFILLP